jgi:hypothetical protein
MKTNRIGRIATLGATSALLVACTAQTTPAGEEESAQTASAYDTSCLATMPVAEEVPFQDSLPLCTHLPSHVSWSSGASYGTRACQYFGVQYDGTTQTSGNLVATVLPATGITNAYECQTANFELAVYGFENTIDPARYGVPGWQPITSVSTTGYWDGFGCMVGYPDGLAAYFNDSVPNPGPTVLRRYTSIAVYAHATAMFHRFGGVMPLELPVSIEIGDRQRICP